MSSVEEEESVDRISDLPSPTLCKILSYLQTKDVIVTSLLSTRWKNLSPFGFSPTHLNLDDSLTEPDTSFLDFVDKQLNITLRNVPRVESFRLCCNRFGIDVNILSWVSSALRLHVQKLVLNVCVQEKYALFGTLSGSTTLVRLVLYLKNTRVKFPDSISLPNLKSLELYDLSFNEGRDSIQGLLNGCPALEDLSVVRFVCNVSNFSICSRTVKNLMISGVYKFELRDCFIFHIPNLRTVTFKCYVGKGDVTRAYHLSGFRSLFKAHIDIQPSVGFGWLAGNGAFEVLAACSNMSRLYLSSRFIDGLYQAMYSSPPLPIFQNLTWLELGCLSSVGWTMLGRLLLNAPNLKELTCKEGLKYKWCREGFKDLEWSESNPICLELHLKNIEFRAFKWSKIEMELLVYFLTKGKVLEEIIIRSRPLDIGTENRLRSLPNNSKIILESM